MICFSCGQEQLKYVRIEKNHNDYNRKFKENTERTIPLRYDYYQQETRKRELENHEKSHKASAHEKAEEPSY